MSRYLLDTDVLIDLSKRREPAVSRIREWIETGDELIVSAVQVAEFYRGVPPEDRPGWDEFFDTLAYGDISQEAARRAGLLRWEYDRRGVVLQLGDTLIAAVALEQRAVLVTNNVRDYPMAGIRLLSLRS